MPVDPAAAPSWPPVEPAPVPPSVPGIPQPVIIDVDQIVASGSIADGSTEVVLPQWQTLDDISATSVSSLGAGVIQITVSSDVAGTVHFGFALGNENNPVEFGSIEVLADTPTEFIGQVGSPLPQTFTFYISSDAADATTSWTGGELTITSSPSMASFPEFIPIIPPPPIGNPVGVPPFPPPTPPPIGVVPVGPLVGPAIAPAGVPPSLAGVVQPQFATGSGTAPPSYFPSFTTTTAYAGFPNQPPTGVPIVYANIFTGGATPVIPPSTPTVAQIILNGMSILAPHLGEDDAGAVSGGHAEPAERSAGTVLSDPDADELHQPEPPSRGRSQRVPPRNPPKRPDRR